MTTPNITTERQRELIAALAKLAARRAKDEVEIRERRTARDQETEREHADRTAAATSEFEHARDTLAAEYDSARTAIVDRYETESRALTEEEDLFYEVASHRHSERLNEGQSLWQSRCQEIQTEFKDRKSIPKSEYVQYKHQCEFRIGEIQSLLVEAQQIATRRCPWPEEPVDLPPLPEKLDKQECLDRAASALQQCCRLVLELQHLTAARFLEEGWPLLLFIFTGVAAAYPVWLALGSFGLEWVAGATLAIALVAAFGVRGLARPIARRQTMRIVPELRQILAQAEAELHQSVKQARSEGEELHRELVASRNAKLAVANSEWDAIREGQIAEHQDHIRRSTTEFQARRATIEESHAAGIAKIEARYAPQIEQLESDIAKLTKELDASRAERLAENRAKFESDWNALAQYWAAGLAEFQSAIGKMNEYCQTRFPAWNDVDWAAWQPRTVIRSQKPEANTTENPSSLAALRFGRYSFGLESLEGGVPKGAGLEAPAGAFELPAVLSFPERPSLLLEAKGEGRDAAMRLIQNVMLRLLTAFPPGKVRFTIVDPVGLGQNFSAFMHLADYDERLVSNRIWTEGIHIHQRLADLTEHMENVIQKYLRNEFASIQEYNEHAGEVAEPFQVLVIANFPANFTDDAARRLVSIAGSGARCGVYTLISTDTKLALPRNFDMADLQTQSETLVWDADRKRFCSKSSDLKRLKLAVESPPDDELFTHIVRSVGKFAKDTSRVEVPFESVVPAPADWWKADSRTELEVPLGRAGAKKLQYMRLGKGTSQHVLISGKTGSGKSTLLNALITNLAIHYAPDELQFYLIDFKKGVEFKAFATHRLPHARVIAIESEREFGMSVLERLDLELKRRGDLFREHGVQGVQGFRNADPAASMPRILLVIDEFQEFFTTDDKISHDASLYLDRLVRQGRAFGIHVLLGSQTLAGAYSLARSTIGQMAVRIALQCSESDAHLILSEDNTAARLLSRPGEAIYNDANGLFEGNHPFQIVWLSDQQREAYLAQLAELAERRALPPFTTTVFEGNVAANPAENNLLRQVLLAPAPTTRPTAPRAWLGSAVAIKDPTLLTFRSQGGNNLLVVGQQEELALGIFASCLVSLSAQLRTDAHVAAAPKDHNAQNGESSNGSTSPQLRNFYILDGTHPESPEVDFWRRLNRQVTRDAIIATPGQAGKVLGPLAAEVDRRLADGEHASDPIFLVVHNLGRFRELKRSDDFGISGFGDDPAPSIDKQFSKILREGPALGIHTLVWCDSFNNLNRWLDRSTIRDLEMRVLFQMSATDSANLMDSPAASRLGTHLAIYYSEEQGQAEKFRPYGIPSVEWLAWIEERLSSRIATTEPAAGDATSLR